MQGRSFAATLVVLITLALPATAPAANFTVSTTGDAGAGSLRAAITSANSTAGRDSISFAIGLGGAQTITLASPLPDITEPVVIAGSTQDAGLAQPITIAGATNAGIKVAAAGGTSAATGTQLLHLRLTGFTGPALAVTGSYAVIQDSVVDTSTGDGATFGAGGQGAVGGLADHGNRIAANGGAGVRVDNGAGAVIVSFNRIGLAASGLGASANAGGGVIVDATGSQVTDNVISGNAVAGVRLADCASVFKRNIVGLGTDGATHVGNSGPGVEVTAVGCQLGSAEADATDTISANTGPGVRIAGNNATVLGERIGTTSAGAATAGNGAEGVLVDGVTGATVGAISFRNKIADNGGDGILLDGSVTAAGGSLAGNDVSANGGDGVALVGAANAPINSTTTTANAGLGIDLGDDGVTGNDAGDADTGPNALQNFPVLQTVRRVVGGLRVIGDIAVDGSGGSYAIELFGNAACDASGNGEGLDPLSGFTLVMPAGAPGTATFDVTVADDTAAGTQVAATATHANRTSELSACRAVTDPAAVVTITPTSRTVLEGASADFTLHRAGDTSASADVDWSTHDGSATAPDDFGAGGSVHFDAGQADALISAATVNDTAVEPDETFTVTLDSVTSSTVTELGTPATATVTIRSQDQDTFIVNDADDAADAALDGVCDAPGADLCTLRAAIQEANADAVADRDTILFADSVTAVALGPGFPAISQPAILSGEIASGRVAIDGNDVSAIAVAGAGTATQTQIFELDLVDAPVEVTGSNVLLADADVSGASGPGVRYGAGATGTIGGPADQANRIFANGGDGVLLDGSAGVHVSANRIGLDGANGGDGVKSSDATAQVFDNTISGNAGAGLRLLACADAVTGNRIGTEADGTGAVPNAIGVVVAGSGCRVGGGSESNVIAANTGHGVLVTGPAAELAGNRIRSNGGDGVAVTGSALITGNLFDANGGLGIDIGDDGVTAQGLPVIASVTREGGQLRLRGTLATGSFLELFSNAACDPSGHGEGAVLLGSAAAAAGEFSVLVPADAAAGTVVSATATANGTTSEFSACATVAESTGSPPPGGTTPPPGGTIPPPGTTQPDPQSTITSPRVTVKARRLKRIRGTSQDAARVDIAVIRVRGRRCFALTRRGTFARRTGPRRCSPRAFFKANGTATWSFRLKRRFPPGRYRIYSRATAADGTREAPPARVRVRVRR